MQLVLRRSGQHRWTVRLATTFRTRSKDADAAESVKCKNALSVCSGRFRWAHCLCGFDRVGNTLLRDVAFPIQMVNPIVVSSLTQLLQPSAYDYPAIKGIIKNQLGRGPSL